MKLLFHFRINLLLYIFFTLIAPTNLTQSYHDDLQVISFQRDLKISQFLNYFYLFQRTAAMLNSHAAVTIRTIIAHPLI